MLSMPEIIRRMTVGVKVDSGWRQDAGEDDNEASTHVPRLIHDVPTLAAFLRSRSRSTERFPLASSNRKTTLKLKARGWGSSTSFAASRWFPRPMVYFHLTETG